jgi:hypothetical protein
VDVKRVLHLVRTALPAGVVDPDDLVVYTEEAHAPGSAMHRIWILHDPPALDPDQPDQHITSAELCALIFELDSVVVW